MQPVPGQPGCRARPCLNKIKQSKAEKDHLVQTPKGKMQKIVFVGPLDQSDLIKCGFVAHMKLLTHVAIVQTKRKV